MLGQSYFVALLDCLRAVRLGWQVMHFCIMLYLYVCSCMFYTFPTFAFPINRIAQIVCNTKCLPRFFNSCFDKSFNCNHRRSPAVIYFKRFQNKIIFKVSKCPVYGHNQSKCPIHGHNQTISASVRSVVVLQ